MEGTAAPQKKLLRSKEDRMLAGVCGGLAKYMGVDPVIMRLGFVVLAIMGGWTIPVYIGIWLLVPEEA